MPPVDGLKSKWSVLKYGHRHFYFEVNYSSHPRLANKALSSTVIYLARRILSVQTRNYKHFFVKMENYCLYSCLPYSQKEVIVMFYVKLVSKGVWKYDCHIFH